MNIKATLKYGHSLNYWLNNRFWESYIHTLTLTYVKLVVHISNTWSETVKEESGRACFNCQMTVFQWAVMKGAHFVLWPVPRGLKLAVILALDLLSLGRWWSFSHSAPHAFVYKHREVVIQGVHQNDFQNNNCRDSPMITMIMARVFVPAQVMVHLLNRTCDLAWL